MKKGLLTDATPVGANSIRDGRWLLHNRELNSLLQGFLLLGWLGVALADARVDEVRCAEIGFSQSAENKDSEAFAAFVDPEARFVAGTTRRGREEVVAGWQGLLTEGGPDIIWRPSLVEVLPSADLALSQGPYRITGADENGVVSESWGHFRSNWRRAADGRWLVVFDSGGDVGMTPTDEERALIAAPVDCP